VIYGPGYSPRPSPPATPATATRPRALSGWAAHHAHPKHNGTRVRRRDARVLELEEVTAAGGRRRVTTGPVCLRVSSRFMTDYFGRAATDAFAGRICLRGLRFPERRRTCKWE
jgi:hypothetical protein